MTVPEIILASTSASRRALLLGAGVDVRCIPPKVDEDGLKAGMRADGLAVHDQAMRLAELKALRVSDAVGGLVIGGDQMLALGNRAFDKPADISACRAQLMSLSGQVHTLETAIVIAESGQVVWRHLARPRLTMRKLSVSFINFYLEKVGTDILSTVGGYKLEGLGSQLFERIEGDYFSILGLPLLPLLDYLRLRGALQS